MNRISANDAENFGLKMYEAEMIIRKYKQFWFARLLMLWVIKIVTKGF